jgi:CubicO group peptidase (beta-lactamase class C family)
VTKVFTATLLAAAVVRGEVRLDTPVRDLLPGVSLPSRDGAQITLEHLATHRSGLPRSPRGLRVAGSLALLRGRNPYAGFEEEDLLNGLAGTRLRRTPGTGRPAYSNAGFGLLGVALARSAGTTYDDLVADRVCRPLGLRDTVTPHTATPDHRTRWASGHRGRSLSAEDWVLSGIAGAGALRSTADDILTFLGSQLDPESTPLADALRLAHEIRVTGRRDGKALGWTTLLQEPPLWWHDGGTGGFRSFAGFVPSRRRAVVVLTNSSRFVDLIALRLLRDLDRADLGRG